MMHYRPDVDGLRAVAVLPVVLYHYGVTVFGGGFIGVDVFFVISGFVITAVILPEIREGRFSIVAFYERRVRRIFPALFAVVAVTTLVAAFLFMPREFKQFGQSAVAATLFASNLLFWNESGYFDAPAESKPLLHTWSLAVEEQFYIAFPLFLLLLWRFAGKSATLWIALTALVSFVLSVGAVALAPTSAFYLPPFRAWELLLGALLALNAVPSIRSARLREAGGLVGLGLIALAVFAFSSETPFPGASALLPCLGAALLIHVGSSGGSTVSRLLGWRPVVFIGLISYSLYMWHWPVIVLARYWAIDELAPADIASAFAVCVAVSIVSWRFVERPFRGKTGWLERRPLFAASGVVMATITAFGVTTEITGGLPGRLPPSVLALAEAPNDFNPSRDLCHSITAEEVRAGELCRLGPAEASPRFVVWGDSHADALQPAFAALARETGVAGRHATHTSCPPLLDYGEEESCHAFNRAMAAFIADRQLQTVFLVWRWSMHDPAAVAAFLPETLEAIAASGAQVVVVEQVPELARGGPNTMARLALAGESPEAVAATRASYDRLEAPVSAVLDRLQRTFHFAVVSPEDVLCDPSRCRSVVDGRSLYRDRHHLTSFGARYVRSVFRPAFARMRATEEMPGAVPAESPPS